MATLTGNTIASTYTGLLSVTGAVGADTVEAVTDGAGTSTSLSLSQQRATITLGSGGADDFIVDGTTLVVEGDNNRVGIGTADPQHLLHLSASGNVYLGINSTNSAATGIRLQEGSTTDTNMTLYRTTDDFRLTTGGSDRLTVLSGGNVGIGVTSPTFMLDIEGEKDGEYICSLINTDSDNGHGLLVRAGDDGNTNSFHVQDVSSNNTFLVRGDGNVGIGTAAPNKNTTTIGNETVLEIRGGDGTDTGFGCAGALYLTSAQDAVVDGNVLGYIGFIGTEDDSGGDAILPGAAIWAEAEGTYDTTGNETALCFSTATSSTAVATANERMRIDKDGKVGIGTATPGVNLEIASSTGNSYVELNANDGSDSGLLFSEETHYQWSLVHLSSGAYATQGDLRVYDYSDSSVAAHLSPGDNVWQAGSDERIKKDVTNIDSALSGINSLRPVTWKRKYGKLDKTYAGLIAQEVKPHFPLTLGGTEDSFKEIPAKDAVLDEEGNILEEAISLHCEGGLSIGYSGFVPYLIKAIQELSAKVTALENA